MRHENERPRVLTCNHPTNQEITCFSRDDQRNVHRDDSSLRYYYPPTRLPEDLNRGFGTFQRRDEADDSSLDSLLDAVVAVERENGRKSDADFITWRGMMTRVGFALCSFFHVVLWSNAKTDAAGDGRGGLDLDCAVQFI